MTLNFYWKSVFCYLLQQKHNHIIDNRLLSPWKNPALWWRPACIGNIHMCFLLQPLTLTLWALPFCIQFIPSYLLFGFLCPKINTFISEEDVFTIFLLQNRKDIWCDSSAASKPYETWLSIWKTVSQKEEYSQRKCNFYSLVMALRW